MGGIHSARAMQYAVLLYKKSGGKYFGEKTGKEKLSKWTKEKWETMPGSPRKALRGGVAHRYLPKKAWEKLSKEERVATDQKKVAGSRKGYQYVPNTKKAKRVGALARLYRSFVKFFS